MYIISRICPYCGVLASREAPNSKPYLREFSYLPMSNHKYACEDCFEIINKKITETFSLWVKENKESQESKGGGL